MILRQDSNDGKLNGRYYTPLPLAQAMVGKLSSFNPRTILEPSCGRGVFLPLAARQFPSASITAIDNDTKAMAHAKDVCQEYRQVTLEACDFFDFFRESKGRGEFDLIIGNPPYIRYQYLTEAQREKQAEILTANGMRPNKLINAWVAFLVACVNLLHNDGVIAFVIPAEFLQVAYAEELRRFLARVLDDITIITFQELLFPDAQQETVILYGRKGNGNGRIRIAQVRNVDEFAALDLALIPFQTLSEENGKWTRYLVPGTKSQLIASVQGDHRFMRFGDCCLINVGITTGNNKYFSITKATEERFKLSDVTLPLIGRSSHIKGAFFTNQDWLDNVNAGKRAMLVAFPDTDYDGYPQGHKAYIALGERNGENTGYKCRIRDRWYIIPSIWVPDAFFLRRNNLYPKLVMNCCGAVSTDTMHRIKFNKGVDGRDILLAYYNSISFAFAETCGRSYGGGVLEILPGEAGRIMIPDVSHVSRSLKDELLQHVDDALRHDGDIERVLDETDERLLIGELGIPRIWCEDARSIWKALRDRRLNRGGRTPQHR